MAKWLDNPALVSAVKDRRHFFMPNAEENSIGWHSVIDNINRTENYDKNDPNIYLRGTILSCYLLNGELSYFNNIGSYLKDKLGARGFSCHLYSSFIKYAETFGKHCDSVDVFFVNIIGTTLFTIYDNNSNFEYKMIPGDLIYIPSQMYHSTLPITPRAGISIGLELDDL